MVFSDYSVGDQGDGVTQLQIDLAKVGFIIDADGIFGPQTKRTVQMFQAARGYPDSGVADAATLSDLASAISEGWTTPSPSITITESTPPPRARAPASAPAAAPTAAPVKTASMLGGGMLLPLAAAGAIGAVFFFGRGGGKGGGRRRRRR